MSDDGFEPPRWRGRLANRFVLVPAVIAFAILAWNLYVATHDHGVVIGRVVDTEGRPVGGATVVLWVLNFTTYVEKARATTEPDGRFQLVNADSHNIQLIAEKPGVGRSVRVPVRLYFRAEDVELHAPLVLAEGG